MKKKILTLTILLGFVVLTIYGLLNPNLSDSVSAKAEEKPELSFDEINREVIANNESPSYSKSKKIVNTMFNNLSVIEIPGSVQDSLANDVALAYLNGTSEIDENNIVSAVNNLVTRADAPAYAQTNVEQVKVVRTFLHRLIPDIVNSNGNMNDIEAFAVFLATASQKVDNEDFMVSPEEFTEKMNTDVLQSFPGTSEFYKAEAVITENTNKMNEMATVISRYTKSKNLVSISEVLSSIGIN